MKFLGEDMQTACLIRHFAPAASAFLKVIKIVRAVLDYILDEFVVVDFDCFHSAHGRCDPATVGRYECERL